MKILLTGTAGFIGFHLAQKLLQKKHEIVSIDNINNYYSTSLKIDRLKKLGLSVNEINSIGSTSTDNHVFHKCDLNNRLHLEKIFMENEPDAVCNLAAQAGVRYSLDNPTAYIDSNINGFLNILECCKKFKVKNLSYASSSSVYGLNQNYPFSVKDNVDHPISLYAASKKSNELMAHVYSNLFGLRTTGLRFFTVYGPWGRPDMALFKFVKAALSNSEIEVYNHGKMKRDFTYIDDIVEAVSRVIEFPAEQDNKWNPKKPDPSSSSAPYNVYNIGNSSPVDLMEFIDVIESELKVKITKKFLPLQLGDVPETYANVDNLYERINFTPKITVQEGVKNFIKWYRGYYGY